MKPEYEIDGPLHEAIGRCGDLYKEVQAIRLAMDKEVKEVKARENQIKQHIIDNLSKSDDTGAVGLLYRVQVTEKAKATVKDWEKFYDFVAEQDRFDMLSKSISQKAAMDYFEEEDTMPPGTEKFNAVGLSVTKK